MIFIIAILFPLIAIASSVWIAIAIVSYVAEIQRDIKSTHQ